MKVVNKDFPDHHNPARVRGEKCDGCAFCVDICPRECLTLVKNPARPRHKLVTVDEEGCSGCGACQGTCPKEAIYIPGLSTDDLRRMVRKALAEAFDER